MRPLTNCALLSAIPVTRNGVKDMFAATWQGSYAQEWLQSHTSQTSAACHESDFLAEWLSVWLPVEGELNKIGVSVFPEATARDLAHALLSHNLVILLAHHVRDKSQDTIGIELRDGILTRHRLAEIAPHHPSTIHLGVCASEPFVLSLKARCASVRVIYSQAGVRPEILLKTTAAALVLLYRDGVDYLDAFSRLRLAMLDATE